MPRFRPETLRHFVQRLLVAAGAGEGEAGVVAASLVESNLHGHDSHGVVLARMYLGQLKRGELVPGAAFEVLHETSALVAADGHLGFGQIQCPRLLDRVAEKARTAGVACGTMRRSGHVGRVGEWVELAAARGLGALMAVNDNGVLRTVSPPGGIAPRVSTNPIAIGIPTPDGPLALDISTSAVANGKLNIARLAKQQVPLGWIQDAEGNPTTDPQVMLADPPGSLLPFGGDQAYKGFGLSLMFDILVAGLSGGFCPPAPPESAESNNVLLVLWDPARCAGQSHFLTEAGRLIDAVRTTPRKRGVDRIRLPGDRAAQTRAERLKSGITIEAGQWEALTHVGEKLGVAPSEEN